MGKVRSVLNIIFIVSRTLNSFSHPLINEAHRIALSINICIEKRDCPNAIMHLGLTHSYKKHVTIINTVKHHKLYYSIRINFYLSTGYYYDYVPTIDFLAAIRRFQDATPSSQVGRPPNDAQEPRCNSFLGGK